MTDNVLTEAEQVNMLLALHRITDTAESEWGREESVIRQDRRTLVTPDRAFKFALQSIDRDGERPYELIISRNRGNNIYGRFSTIQMVAADEGGNATINDLIDDLYAKAHVRPRSEEKMVMELFDALKSPESNPKDPQTNKK